MLSTHFILLAALSAPEEPKFYLPHDPKQNIVQSAMDSVRFTVEKCLKLNDKGHLVAISSFVDPEGKVMSWHDFGNLEGPGWAANAVGGAYELYELGRVVGKAEWQAKALRIVEHVLDDGFVDESTGFIKGYYDLEKKQFCLNYKHNSDWFCPGSMAKIAFQMLTFAEALGKNAKGGAQANVSAIAKKLQAIALRTGEWCHAKVPACDNGWFPRRMTPSGTIYKKSPDGGDDKFWQTSADGLFILQLWARLKALGLADYSQQLAERTAVFAKAGGIFGSINHDTYDPSENVAYSVAFRTLLEVSSVLSSGAIRTFAYSRCLGGLDQFQMKDDRNGVATKGLLFMEKSWPTAYLWENAEAALAYFEAASDLRSLEPDVAKRHELTGLTILRAIAKHHHGPHGFLTEGVDWSNHVGKQHHIGQAEFAAIQYTEPFLNNQHIVEPTVYYLDKLAARPVVEDGIQLLDAEGNALMTILLHDRPTGKPGGVILKPEPR